MGAKRILLGITGGIAAYKSAELVRLLKKAGCEVRVVMTRAAEAFVTPLTFQALSGEPVRTSLLDPEAEAGMGHIELAKWADQVVVAPASADFLARLAQGLADDLLTTVCCATEAPIILAPAMNQAMWRNPRTQRNVALLRDDPQVCLWGPDQGEQACGDTGPGPDVGAGGAGGAPAGASVGEGSGGDPAGTPRGDYRRPTREPLDPVRYLSNHSSGKMATPWPRPPGTPVPAWSWSVVRSAWRRRPESRCAGGDGGGHAWGHPGGGGRRLRSVRGDGGGGRLPAPEPRR